jgi:3-isopropylmalate dehydrogenase
VLKHGHGLWLQVFECLKPEYPRVQAHAIHADALLCALVQNPQPFGVIAADNFIGDLVSDLLAAFQGGMGLAASASYNPQPDFRCRALYEPVHGSAPNLAGQEVANPAGMILSTAMLFRRVGWEAEAQRIENAVCTVLTSDRSTQDLGGNLTCRQMGKAVLDNL